MNSISVSSNEICMLKTASLDDEQKGCYGLQYAEKVNQRHQIIQVT